MRPAMGFAKRLAIFADGIFESQKALTDANDTLDHPVKRSTVEELFLPSWSISCIGAQRRVAALILARLFKSPLLNFGQLLDRRDTNAESNNIYRNGRYISRT
jgi:hypothetical protein